MKNNENSYQKLIDCLNDEIVAFNLDKASDYDAILDKIGDSRIVLLGESSHGTKEFYQTRAELSKALILKKNFHAIAIEGDWTSCYAVHQYIQGNQFAFHKKQSPTRQSTKEHVTQVNDQHVNDQHDSDNDTDNNSSDNKNSKDLKNILNESFNRFPLWMWNNDIMHSLILWLKDYNEKQTKASGKLGFYGLDLYCLNDSINAILKYLEANDKKAFEKALERYACFENLVENPESYGYLVSTKLKSACIKETTDELLEMHQMAFNKIHSNQLEEKEALFYQLQNAKLIKNAENYYRSVYEENDLSWNVRDQHMGETLQNIIAHLETKINQPPKIIVWAHNSHIGDARATEMSERKEINLGQIVRENFDLNSFHIGFTTYRGSVTAASDWDGKHKAMTIVPGLKGSYEALFHELKDKNFWLDLHIDIISHKLQLSRLERAIGVIYRPDTELQSHYFFARLPYQFDMVIHFDQTNPLHPLY